jgi:hypothetical protein
MGKRMAREGVGKTYAEADKEERKDLTGSD